ncbi:hypothetical protein LXA10_18090, partial [Erwinia amylovora]
FALAERFRLLQDAADTDQYWHDQAANQVRFAPAPLGHFNFIHQVVQHQSYQCGKDNINLLNGGLTANVE